MGNPIREFFAQSREIEIARLWFEDAATLEAAFSSPAGQVTMAHAKTFLAEITAFVVVEHRVI